jgi:hypothetical protein
MTSPLQPWIPAVVVVVVGCTDAVDLASTQAAIQCEPYVCGQNSPDCALMMIRTISMAHLESARVRTSWDS